MQEIGTFLKRRQFFRRESAGDKMKQRIPFTRVPNQCARVVFKDSKEVLGLFYDSYDRSYHLASYIPYASYATDALCGRSMFDKPTSAGFYERKKIKYPTICAECYKMLLKFPRRSIECNTW